MQTKVIALMLIGTFALASCGQQTTTPSTPAPAPQVSSGSVAERIAEYAQRPELQSPEAQAFLRENGNDPLTLDSLDRAYGVVTTPFDAEAFTTQRLGAQDRLSEQATGKAGYAQSVAWGTYSNFLREKASPDYSGLIWTGYDGCSAPSGFGLGYRTTFQPACFVHDFGYRNLPRLTAKWAWPYNKGRTDSAFLSNMRSICGDQPLYRRPDCYLAAQAYYKAVDVGGWKSWIDGAS